MPLKYQKRLIEHLRHRSYTPRRVDDLARDLGLEDDGDFPGAIDQLSDLGLIEVSPGGLVTLPSMGDLGGEIVGTFRKAAKGFGFIQPDNPTHEGDLFVPAEAAGDALSGDRVRAVIRRDKFRGGQGAGGGGPGQKSPYIGIIVEVLERKRKNFTGELRRQGKDWLVYPDGKELTDPIMVRDAEAKNAKAGDKVVVEITAYPEGALIAEGVIVKVLGESGRPDVETQAVIAAFNLPGEFPEECVEQAREASGEFDRQVDAWKKGGPKALENRDDITADFICTIDPPDAKDYDDAISIRRSDKGWELGVHIADVAHFIPPGSPLDEEAKERGNSVYLPRLVIPMLPEVLSNGICSLQEGVPRFCKTAWMTYNDRGEVQKQGVSNSLIKSSKRMTYLEAQALIDGNLEEAKKHAKTETKYTDELVGALREMDALAKAIKERRRRQGMISLELPDVVLIYDENGHVIDAEKEDDAFTHTLIEMLMVEANEALARLFEGLNVPLLRRVHPEPTPGNVEDMRKTARVAGYTIPPNPTREQLQALLDATRGTPVARAVHLAVLRTLTKAEYSPALIGHYALASDAYAHFTSPIRRYADLTVHRALAEYLRLTDNGKNRPKTDEDRLRLGKKLREAKACPDEQTLVGIGRHITVTEENAEDAERQLRQFLVLQLLAEHIGESYQGLVTGVNPRGVFIQLDKYLADGFIKKEDLPGDVTRSNKPPFWKIDVRTGGLVDQNSGRSFNMGDSVMVRIAQVNLARRQMDLVLDNAASRAGGKAKMPVALAGGMGGGIGAGAGFKALDFNKLSGTQRRSQKSKSRDKGKKQHRRDNQK